MMMQEDSWSSRQNSNSCISRMMNLTVSEKIWKEICKIKVKRLRNHRGPTSWNWI